MVGKVRLELTITGFRRREDSRFRTSRKKLVGDEGIEPSICCAQDNRISTFPIPEKSKGPEVLSNPRPGILIMKESSYGSSRAILLARGCVVPSGIKPAGVAFPNWTI